MVVSTLFDRTAVPVDNLLSFTPLSIAQQQYLTEVYALLAIGFVTTWGGYYLANSINAFGGFLPGVLCIGLVVYIHATSPPVGKKDPNNRRLCAFLALTGVTGAAIAPIIDTANLVNPAILSTALLGTAVAFVSFSLAAMFAPDRKYLAMGGSIAAATGYLALVRMAHYFFRSPITHSLLLWGGLALSCLYILYYTQASLYEFDKGKRDHVRHALLFYVECIDIFLRLVRILLENERRKRKNDEDRD